MDKATVEKARLFGEKVGIAFQIKDDLFDYGKGTKIGKPTGIDIQEKKVTLPLLYAINSASDKDKKRITKKVLTENKKAKSVKEVIDFVLNSGGIEYTVNKMNEYVAEAKSILADFPDSPAKEALNGLVDYTILREK